MLHALQWALLIHNTHLGRLSQDVLCSLSSLSQLQPFRILAISIPNSGGNLFFFFSSSFLYHQLVCVIRLRGKGEEEEWIPRSDTSCHPVLVLQVSSASPIFSSPPSTTFHPSHTLTILLSHPTLGLTTASRVIQSPSVFLHSDLKTPNPRSTSGFARLGSIWTTHNSFTTSSKLVNLRNLLIF